MATTSDMKVDGVTSFGLISYRYIFTLHDKKLSIWLENCSNKTQWKSGSLNKTDFVTSANAFLDAEPADYISALNSVLHETEDVQRELIQLKHDSIQLKLTVNVRIFESVRKATYEFELFPVSVDRMDILESKLRDVQEQQSLAPIANVWLYHASRSEVTSSSKLLWTDLEATNFKIVPDKASVEWLRSGAFSISVVINHLTPSSLGSIVLYKNDEKIQVVMVGGSGIQQRCFVKATSTMMCITMMKRGDQLSISFIGTAPTAPAYMTVLHLGQ